MNPILYDRQGAFIELDVDAKLPVGWDWADWLVANEQATITSSAWQASAALTIALPQLADGVASAIVSVTNADEALIGTVATYTNVVQAGPNAGDAMTMRVKIVRRQLSKAPPL